MEKFLYVFSKEARDDLLLHGYSLLKGDDTKEVYVFANQDNFTFDLSETTYVRSNILTF